MEGNMSDTPDINTLSFEEAFAALESVVAALEKEQQPLDEILALYGRGQLLARRCATLLDQAELRVLQLQSDGSTSQASLKLP
jgi:exodeoxyribonuclease VII small subunit